MEAQVVVWNVDARNRPELEVEIEVELVLEAAPEAPQADEVDDELLVLAALELDDLDDPHPDDGVVVGGWFIDDGASIVDDLRVIYDAPPAGYAQAYRASA